MIPIKDDLPARSFPLITISLIAMNVLAFLYQLSLGEALDLFLVRYGAVPFHLMRTTESVAPFSEVVISPVTSMFLHGSLLHLGGNMLYLWIFGNNIEDVMGRARFVLFYLLCGMIAVYTHARFVSESHVPMIGASGAVAGILGGYLLLFPRARVLTLIPLGFFITTVRLPAMMLILLWFITQIVNSLLTPTGSGGVAWFAHIGGFVAGLALLPLFIKRRRA